MEKEYVINKDELDLMILKIIDIIKKENNPNLLSYPKTIHSFLLCKEASPHYEIYKKYANLFKKYNFISELDVNNSLRRLLKSKQIIECIGKTGKIMYCLNFSDTPNTIVKLEKPSSENEKTFYETATLKEKNILDQFKNKIKVLLPEYELLNKEKTYGFASKIKEGEIQYKLCWISRNKKTGKLCLHFKKNIEGNEKILSLTNKSEIEEAWRQLDIAYSTSIDEIENIVKRIRSKDFFDDYQTTYISDKLFLMPHQKAGAKLAEKYNRFAFFYDTGTGKTVMALQIISNHQFKNNARFLIIAPKALIKSAWLDDSKYFPKMKLLPLSKNMTVQDYAQLYDYWQLMDGNLKKYTDDDGNILEKIDNKTKDFIINELFKKAHHFIINIDSIRDAKKGNDILQKTKCNGLIIDESAIIKNYDTLNAQRMRVFAKKMDYVYLLSGKPAPNTTIEYYSQMKIIDSKTFNLKYDEFIEKYYKEVNHKYVFKNDKSRDEVVRMVGNRSITLKKEECIQLPEAFHQRRLVSIDDKTKIFYRNILNNFITEIASIDGKKIKVTKLPKLASIMKLREIASGFYLDKANSYTINFNKINEIKNLLEEIGYNDDGKRKKVLIWCNFKYEIESIENELINCGYKVVTAYSGTKELDKNIEDFKSGDAEIMIAHPQTLKYGITFIKCYYCIFSSMSYSYEDYYQAHDRIYRNGQENVCFFYHLISEDTIDDIIYRCVIEKANKTKLFERLIKSAYKYNISKESIKKSLNVDDHMKEIAVNNNDLIN